MIKALIVGDHPLMRTGIALLLKAGNNVEILGEASSKEAIKMTKELNPELVILDINMPDLGGMEAITLLLLRTNPKQKILIISNEGDGLLPLRLVKLGIIGYVTKFASHEELLKAVNAISQGESYIDTRLLDHPIKNNKIFKQITEREFQILSMVAHGIAINEIAQKLGLSPKTINGYKASLHRKLGVSSDLQLIKVATREGLLYGEANNFKKAS